jgi:hypothetical protein
MTSLGTLFYYEIYVFPMKNKSNFLSKNEASKLALKIVQKHLDPSLVLVIYENIIFL